MGAFFVSGGWTLISGRKSIHEWVKKTLRIDVNFIIVTTIVGLLSVAVGLVLVGFGGTLTTFGWNQLDNASKKNALIVSLAREWLLNELYTIRPPMSFDANDPKLGKEHFMYPQFRTSAQDRILTSELFDLRSREDKELLVAVVCYEQIIKDFNTQLAWVNEECARFPENVVQQERKEVYLRIRDKAPLHIHFKRFHKELLKLLEKEYSWALVEARPALANIHRLQE
jgi:hypothetical protein